MKLQNLVARDTVNDTQRKSLGLGAYIRREREPNEALPRTMVFEGSYAHVNPAVRVGADDHLKYKSRGDL